MKVFKKYLRNFIQNYRDTIKISDDCNFEDIRELTTDSRKLAKNDLFIALKGENYNGNEYIDECIQKGASICIGEVTSGNKLISIKNSEKNCCYWNHWNKWKNLNERVCKFYCKH